jgi:hypothetical protein
MKWRKKSDCGFWTAKHAKDAKKSLAGARLSTLDSGPSTIRVWKSQFLSGVAPQAPLYSVARQDGHAQRYGCHGQAD